MHELAIAQSALKHVLLEAARARAARVDRIVLRIGPLSGVDPEALRFAFAALLPTTAAAGATVELETPPAAAHCPACGHHFAPTAAALLECPQCHALGASLVGGRELDLVSIDCS